MRSTPESVQAILDGMDWLGLDYDEGPYYQTQRFDRYAEVVQRLLEEGKAYPFRNLARTDGSARDEVGGEPLIVHFNTAGPTAFATDAAGVVVSSVVIYWKYLADFFPGIEIWAP